MDLGQGLLLLSIGLFCATYGTLIGASGSFILVPTLLFLYPGESPNAIAAVTLSTTFLTAISATLAYGRLGRIHYRGGVILGIGTISGGLLGAVATGFLSRTAFEIVVGTFLLGAVLYQLASRALYLVHNHNHKGEPFQHEAHESDPPSLVHTHLFHPFVGIASASGVGFLAGLIGIGGGPLLVPVMVKALHFPIHIAAGTSLFSILPQAFAGSLEHIWAGDLVRETFLRVPFLAIGMIAGAQIGARLSHRLQGYVLMRILYFSLAFLGATLILRALVD